MHAAARPSPRRRRPPPMCIRHELSQAQTLSAPEATIAASFSSSIAAETSAFLTANVPPKPQHSSASGRSTQLDPGHGAEQPQRRVTDPQQPQRVAGRVVRHRALVRRADVLDAQDAREELRQLPGSRRHAAVVPAEQAGHVLPHLRRARAGRRHDGVVGREDLDEPAREQLRLAGIARSSRASARSTSARPGTRPRSRAARAPSPSPCRPPGTACRRDT